MPATIPWVVESPWLTQLCQPRIHVARNRDTAIEKGMQHQEVLHHRTSGWVWTEPEDEIWFCDKEWVFKRNLHYLDISFFLFRFSADVNRDFEFKKAGPVCRLSWWQSEQNAIRVRKLVQQLHFPGEKQSRETKSLLWILASAGLNWPGAFCMAEDQMFNRLNPWVAA